MNRLLVALVSPALLAASLAWSHDADEGKDRLGKVSFPTSCDPKVQPAFERAVAMLHSFWFSEGEKAFRKVLADDPGCAIADWGVASLLMSNPLAGQGASPKGAEQAQAALDEARRIGAKTQRERDYIESAAAYYQDFATKSEKDRQLARAKAYEALAARYPDDDEAQIFFALYNAATQSQADQTYAAYLRSAAILETQLDKHPDHPGVAHYLIHSYDAPPIAAKGLLAARRYAGIAPDAPHALHMPSHIFTRVGAWEESASTNVRSADVARRGGTDSIDEAYHASDYMVYAYLQLARDEDARRTIEEIRRLGGQSPRFIAPYATASMMARYAVERGDWKAASELQPVAESYPFTNAITWFARGLGSARTGDVTAARAAAEQLDKMHDSLAAAKNTYWATEVEVQRQALAAWIALAQKDETLALKLMNAAADLEDRNEKHIVTPGRLLPARELLGDMLLQAGDAKGALRELQASQKREPNRFRNYALCARAADAAGEREKARECSARLVDLAKGANGAARPEVVLARASIARQ